MLQQLDFEHSPLSLYVVKDETRFDSYRVGNFDPPEVRLVKCDLDSASVEYSLGRGFSRSACSLP